MSLHKSFTSRFTKIFSINEVHAHCDIPCGIYDPHLAQVAAHSVIRMVQLIEALENPNSNVAVANSLSRYISVKEEHAELCKQEIRIIWAAYFKPEHVEKYPDLHEQVFNALKLGSAVRQSVDLESSQKLLAAVQKIAEIFWATKGVETKKVSSNYPSGGDLVVPA